MPTNPEDYKYNSYTIKNDRGDYLVRCMICGEKSNGELIPDDAGGEDCPIWFSCYNCGEDCWLPLP